MTIIFYLAMFGTRELVPFRTSTSRWSFSAACGDPRYFHAPWVDEGGGGLLQNLGGEDGEVAVGWEIWCEPDGAP